MNKLKDLNKPLRKTLLCDLGTTFGTDKPRYGYTRVYDNIMIDKELDNVSILEIGILKGYSLRMWDAYFVNGTICGIDNGRKVANSNIKYSRRNETPTPDDLDLLKIGHTATVNGYEDIETERIKCFTADQRSYSQLQEAFQYFKCQEFDYIVDDGQHFQEHQQKSLAILFKHIKPGGYYIIEDVADRKELKKGAYWGQKEKDLSDSTDLVFSYYIETGVLNSPYMTEEEMKYIENNMEDIHMFDCCGRNNSPITGTSKLLVIKKK